MSDTGHARHVEMVPVDHLLPADSPRVHGEDATHVQILADIRDRLPPIVVHRETMRVIDGMHRLRAAIARGDREIAAEFFDGSAAEAFLRAVHDNVVHGLPLSRSDREAAVARIIRSGAGLSDRAIAAVVGLSPPTVGAIRKRTTDKNSQSNVRIGQDGRVRPLNAAEGRIRASRIMAENPDASLRAVARDAKISLSTAQDVRKRMVQGEDPVPAKSAPQPPAAQVPQPRSGRAPGDTEASLSVLRTLRRDPSLRSSETGRALLHWLSACAIRNRAEEIVNAIPEHCTVMIADLARSCAASWNQLSIDLERRSGRSGSVTRRRIGDLSS